MYIYMSIILFEKSKLSKGEQRSGRADKVPRYDKGLKQNHYRANIELNLYKLNLFLIVQDVSVIHR